eukprot:Blabericola_migrator_1__4852@NODE_2542_length_2627_cov_219_626563_g454_i2_p2_GENE_NODE_2542_length_2627_cov_219_626563_g454_i2NODE_2542_length_2627_cov_219_626563_g454_i2_p2_ORF_typecomplete_len173_score39_93HTH_43/PF09904_9/5_3HTH_43/PF09904_9/4_7HTH_43/PF09904_9/24MgtE_N/PF03448_17/0_64_NODE_2542_length_2627_cov_219_626563_g454_i27491267
MKKTRKLQLLELMERTRKLQLLKLMERTRKLQLLKLMEKTRKLQLLELMERTRKLQLLKLMEIENETALVAKLMAGDGTSLFFNGSKFHLTQKDTSDDNITWVVMGSAGGRGLHCAITPDKDCMVVAAASQKALPTEQIMGVKSSRPAGSITVDSRSLAGQFRAFAPGALGI